MTEYLLFSFDLYIFTNLEIVLTDRNDIMSVNQEMSLPDDLETRLEDLCWIHDHSALYLSDFFFELRNQIDIDTEEHLQALNESITKNIEMSRVHANNVRSEFIRLLKKIEDELLRKVSASTEASKSQSSYGTLPW